MSEIRDDTLNQIFDELLFQLSKGVTIEQLEKGSRWMGFGQVREWKSRFGYQFHIHPNDHLIDKKPHFHLKKPSENIDCRIFFDGTVYDCEGKGRLDKKILNTLNYFLSKTEQQKSLIEIWNQKNPNQFYGLTNEEIKISEGK